MKQIEGWSGYCITEGGDAISFKRKKPKELNKINVKGYLRVNLCRDGEVCQKSIHRLVAEAFIPNPLGLPDVNHKNEDKTDNRVENLEWVTHKENINYGTRTERSAKTLTNRSDISKPIVAYIYKSGEWYGEYPSVREAARQLGLSHSNISSCCNGKHKHTGGYVFRYKDV